MLTLERSARRARNGKGDLRFVEEPDTAEAGDRVDALLAELAKEALVVDIGSMLRFGAADLIDFLRAYRQALARALAAESYRSLRRFGRLVDTLGLRGFFGGYPLGRLIYGEDGDEEAPSLLDHERIIRAMTSFGRRRRPLVLVVRGGECVQQDLTDFFLSMAPVLKTRPACLFVFGEDFPASLRRYKSALS